MARLRPSIQPTFSSDCRNAVILACASATLSAKAVSTPIRRIPAGCCARAASGHAAATTEQRDELAASHCPIPPVLPTERIAHLGTADCCIHPPGRNEMIAITPSKIFSKEVAQNRPPHFPHQQPPSPPNFQGWGLDENLKPKLPPYRGAHIDVRWQDKNEVGLAARAAMLAPAPVPPAITAHAAAPPFTTVQKKHIS